MKQMYIVVSILVLLLGSESAFAIGALQYAALGSEQIVKELLTKAEKGEKLTPLEVNKVNANLNSLVFTQPSTAKKYQQVIRDNKNLAKLFPLFTGKKIVLINKKTKKAATESDIQSKKGEFSKKVQDVVQLFQVDQKKASKEWLVLEREASNLDTLLKNKRDFHDIIDAEKTNFEEKTNEKIDAIIKKNQEEVDNEKIEEEAWGAIDNDFDFGLEVNEQKGKIEQLNTLKMKLQNNISESIKTLNTRDLKAKMGGSVGYGSVYEQLMQVLEEYKKLMDTATLTSVEKNDFTGEFSKQYQNLITIVTEDLMDNTIEYRVKKGGIIGRSKLNDSIQGWHNEFSRYTKNNQEKKLANNPAILEDINIFILDYKKHLNVELVKSIFGLENYFNQSARKEFSEKFADLFLGFDNINNVYEPNHYSIRGLIVVIKQYIDNLEKNNQGATAALYKSKVVKPLEQALISILDAFNPYLELVTMR